MDDHAAFMARAIELSEENVNNGGGPFGAVIVKNNKVIAEGINLVTVKNDPTAHAEVTAIRNAAKALSNYDLSGCVIYTSCEPCPMCLSAIYWAKIDKMFYGNTKKDAHDVGFSDSFIYQEIHKPISQRKLISVQIMNQRALGAFELWQNKADKTEY